MMTGLSPNATRDVADTADMETIGRGASHLGVQTFGLTDKGKARPQNEDQFLIARLLKGLQIQQTSLAGPKLQYGHDRSFLFVVADGVGGHAGGEAASALAVDAVESFVLETFKWFLQFKGSEADELIAELRGALGEAHARILAAAADHRELEGMATTLTLALSVNDLLTVAHAGDSRCYLWRNQNLLQITRDHTLVGEMVRGGHLSPEEVAKHHLRHVVTNVVGGGPANLKVDIHRVQLQAGDTILLCTDGLTEMVPNDVIADVLRLEQDAERACRRLVDLANAAGGHDNITVVLARYDAASTTTG